MYTIRCSNTMMFKKSSKSCKEKCSGWCALGVKHSRNLALRLTFYYAHVGFYVTQGLVSASMPILVPWYTSTWCVFVTDELQELHTWSWLIMIPHVDALYVPIHSITFYCYKLQISSTVNLYQSMQFQWSSESGTIDATMWSHQVFAWTVRLSWTLSILLDPAGLVDPMVGVNLPNHW